MQKGLTQGSCRLAAHVGDGRWAECVALVQWAGQWAKQMRQPYDIICAALFAFYPLCEECRAPSGFINGQPQTASSAEATAEAEAEAEAERHRRPVHQPHQRKVNICIIFAAVCVCQPASQRMCVCVCVICGWQRATAALGMFTLQNAITAATAADDKENRIDECETAEKERGREAGKGWEEVEAVEDAKQNNILVTHTKYKCIEIN